MIERPQLAAGTLVAGRYRVSKPLGQGGMGAVYLAEHVQLRKSVALKMLLPELAGAPEVVERFLQEARAAASLGHPGIVDVTDLGQHEGAPFVVMELLDGEELAARILRDPPLPFTEVARLGALVCDAIAAAHERGIVHRDLKPANVFLVRGEEGVRIKVLDFGIAKVARAEVAVRTQTGQVIGTPHYMSPEQLRDSSSVDARTDVYAIGAMLFEMLARRPPFVADSYPALVLAVCGEEQPDLRSHRPDVPPALEAIVRGALSKSLETRTASAAQLGAALRSFQRASEAGALDATLAQGPPSMPPARSEEAPRPPTTSEGPRARWPAIALVAALGAGVAAWFLSPEAPRSAEAPSPPSASSIVEAPADAPPIDTPVAVEAPVDPPVEPPVEHRLEVDVDPIGALVRDARGMRCNAPCVLLLPEGPAVLTVSAEGRLEQEVRLTPPLPSRFELTLSRAPRRGASPPALPPLRSP